MGFSVNYKELSAYLSSITVMKDEFHSFLKKFLIEMANRVIAKTKPRTPKETGALRSAWELGEISGVGENIYIEIKNPMEYATDIEYGHRIMGHGSSVGIEFGWYEGRFMLKISIDEVRRQMPLRYQSRFKEFCKENGLIV